LHRSLALLKPAYSLTAEKNEQIKSFCHRMFDRPSVLCVSSKNRHQVSGFTERSESNSSQSIRLHCIGKRGQRAACENNKTPASRSASPFFRPLVIEFTAFFLKKNFPSRQHRAAEPAAEQLCYGGWGLILS
jgi:hypothetical protein